MEASDVDSSNVTAAKDLVKKEAFHPGSIRYTCHREGGSYSGCLLKRFISETGPHEAKHATDLANEFFKANENCTVVDMWVQDHEVVVLYTNFMDAEELEDFNDAAEELRNIMGRKREERAKREAEAATDEEKAAKEAARLQEVGRKCEANHGKKARKK